MVARVLTLLCLALALDPPAVAGSPVIFGGLPVELTISQVSDSTTRLQLVPLNEQGQPLTEAPSPALVPFSVTQKFRTRELHGCSEFRAGKLRVTVEPSPLAISLRREDGSLVQRLVFANDGTNVMMFQVKAPVLGLGEGGAAIRPARSRLFVAERRACVVTGLGRRQGLGAVPHRHGRLGDVRGRAVGRV